MKKKHIHALLIATIVISASLIVPIASQASALDCGILSETICKSADNDEAKTVADTGVWKFLVLAVNILAVGAAIAAIGGIVYGAIVYTTAGGEPSQVKKARTILINVTIGIIAFGSMYALLQWLMPGGVLNGDTSLGDRSRTQPNDPTNPSNPDTPSKPTNPTDPKPTTPTPPAKAATACYWNPNQGRPSGKMYHIPPEPSKVPYAFENSPEGVKHAAKNGYSYIDIDLQVTKDGVIVASHTVDPLQKDVRWGGFTDTSGKYKAGSKVKIKDMIWAEVSKLKHKDGYTIHRVEDILKQAKASGIDIRFELKSSVHWQEKLPELAALVNQYKVKTHIASFDTKPGAKQALKLANQLGFWTRNLTPGHKAWGPSKLDKSLCKKLEG